jgi:AcrR family transcriptional regulator
MEDSAMSQDVREQILDAALRVLERDGVQGFRQTRIAKEAGLEQGHLTYYFPRRPALVLAVLERYALRVRQERLQLLGQQVSGPVELRALARAVIKHSIRDRGRTRLMLSLAMEAEAEAEPQFSQLIAEAFRTQEANLARVFGREPGDPDVVIALAALRGLGIEALLARSNDERFDRLVDRIAELLEVRSRRPPKTT